jgi:hypothetical protein
MIYDAVREIYESTYCDTCSILEKVKRKIEGLVSFVDEEVVSNQPCKISFESIPSTTESNTTASMVQSTKLFLAPEIEVKPGSRINVTHLGVTTAYKRSGKPAVYHTHQEIMLELWEDKA